VEILDPLLPVSIRIGKNAKFILRGRLAFEFFQGLREIVFISIGENSTLIIDGDFNLGPGCRIIVEAGG
jgi:hypothetical protein